MRTTFERIGGHGCILVTSVIGSREVLFDLFDRSANDVKNNCCLFERLFKVKNGVFLFEISFFVLEIFTFLYYANEESDDVINRYT